MPALVRGVIPGKAPSFPMPLDHPSSGLRPAPAPKLAPGPSRMSGTTLHSAVGKGQYEGPRLAKAVERSQHRGGGGILGFVESLPGKVAGALAPGLEQQYPSRARGGGAGQRLPGATALPPGMATPTVAGGAFGRKAEAVGLALAKNPTGTLGHTAASIPSTLNAMVTGTARTVGTAVTGHPERAVKELAHAAANEFNERYGKSLGQDVARIEKQGVLPEVLDATSVLGGSGAIAGRFASKLAEAGGIGAEDFAKTAAWRDAVTHAYQAPNVQEFLRRKDLIPQEPTRAQKFKATLHESATQPRPNLRTAPGREAAKVQEGAAVREQPRSPNLTRAMAQTTLDNARRARMQGRLARVMEARQTLAENPRFSGYDIPRDYRAGQLDFATRRGEVAPVVQRGSRNLGQFFGAERAQRIGAAYGKGNLVRERRGIADAYGRTYRQQLAQMTPEQKKLVDYAKEGHLNINDPQKARAWLQEIHDQAKEGADRLRLPLEHVVKGADVARETGALLDHIDKHGPESVFTPEFAKLVETLPDERLVSPKNPVLQANPDRAIARKYLPQMHMLAEWARRHPDHPDAFHTEHAVRQIHQLLEEGHDLRQAEQHAQATDKFATAKNLADEVARMHGLPTDRAYVPHTVEVGRGAWEHTVGNVSPRDYQRWRGILQAKGTLLRDPELPLRAIERSLRDEFTQRNVNEFEQRFAMDLPKVKEKQADGTFRTREMNQREAVDHLRQLGLDPEHFQVMHLGKLRDELAHFATADHLEHLNSDPQAHARTLEEAWARAGDLAPGDTTPGVSVVPKAAYNETRASFQTSGKPLRRPAGKLKGEVSKLMLGLSIPWATTMGFVTYPVQSLMGGAGPFGALAHFRSYLKHSEQWRARFDQAFGVDNPFRVSSHGIEAERMGNALPRQLDALSQTMRVARQSPIGRLLSKANPVKAVIAAERVPRRYARINVAMKGLRNIALQEMLREMHGGQQAINRFELQTQKLLHFGRMPAQKYIDKALANTKEVERLAQHLDNALGQWHNTTAFERNYLNSKIMFYPWMRYSLKLATHTLPAHHPLLYSIALKLGTWEHRALVELLGTEPEPGTVYLGAPQPNVPPAQRKFQEIGIKQANPTLNTAIDALAGSPSELLDLLPPYITSALEWAVGKNLFTDKPLRGAQLGESKEMKGRPNPFLFAAHQIEQTLAPTRIAGKRIAAGRPQSAESAPAFGFEKPTVYSRKIERAIQREKGKEPSILSELVPLIPHEGGKLKTKIESEQREAKEQKKLARQRARRASGGGFVPPPPPAPPPAAPPPPPPPPPASGP